MPDSLNMMENAIGVHPPTVGFTLSFRKRIRNLPYSKLREYHCPGNLQNAKVNLDIGVEKRQLSGRPEWLTLGVRGWIGAS